MTHVNQGPVTTTCPPVLYCYVCDHCMHQWHRNGQKAVMMLKHMAKHQKKRSEMVTRLRNQLQRSKTTMWRFAVMGNTLVVADIAQEIKQDTALLVRWERLPIPPTHQYVAPWQE